MQLFQLAQINPGYVIDFTGFFKLHLVSPKGHAQIEVLVRTFSFAGVCRNVVNVDVEDLAVGIKCFYLEQTGLFAEFAEHRCL